MNRSFLRKRPNRAGQQEVKISDILSFTSAIMAIAATAIFYFAGWVYLSHWYSFFGIDATELDLAPQIILIHGVPGILVVVLTGLVTASIFAILKLYVGKGLITTSDLPTLIVLAYFLSVIFLLGLILLAYNDVKVFLISFEVQISITSALIITILLTGFDQIVEFAESGLPIGVIPFPLSRIKPITLAAWAQSVMEASKTGNFRSVIKVVLQIEADAKEQRKQREQKILSQVSQQKLVIRDVVIRTSQFWIGAFLILYFLISISVSSIFGEWDARVGRKSMVGGWQLEQTYIFSPSDNLPLPLDSTKSTATLKTYGPLILLGSSGNKSFLTDWVSKFPYTQKPNLYIIPMDGSNAPSAKILAPTPTPTKTPFQSKTPTAVPTILATPTP